MALQTKDIAASVEGVLKRFNSMYCCWRQPKPVHLKKLKRSFTRVLHTLGTTLIPQNYYLTHQQLGTCISEKAQEHIQHILTDEEMRKKYD